MKSKRKFLGDPRWSKTMWLSNLSIRLQVTPSINTNTLTSKQKRKYINEFNWKFKQLNNSNITRDQKYNLLKRLNYIGKELRDKAWLPQYKKQINTEKDIFAMEEINITWPQVIKRDNSTVDKNWRPKKQWYYIEYKWDTWFHVSYSVWNHARKIARKKNKH